MPTNTPLTIIKAIWPSARRRAQKAQSAHERIESARHAAEAQEAASKHDDAEALRIRAYEAHVRTLDLNGVGTRSGKPLAISELLKEVERRLDLAAALGRDRQIKNAEELSDTDMTKITGKLDRTALDWLLDHSDPERQRAAAKKILDARADLAEKVPLDDYVSVVAEKVVRLSGLTLRRHKVAAAVMVRAILLRSTDARWQAQRHGALRPLSATPYSSR